MHKIVFRIHEYLEKAANGQVTVDPKLLQEFGQRIQDKLKRQLEENKPFKLRMSNIGRPLRQLMLEQKYGKEHRTPELILKMLFGDMYEALLLYLLKASGVDVVEHDVEVTMPIKTNSGIVNLDGTLDVAIKIDGETGIYDVKSASPYSFENKFDGTAILSGDDSFGYVEQLFAYANARKQKAKGWIVINKVNGEIKVDVVPESLHDDIRKKSIEKIESKVQHIVEGKPIPDCTGVIEETFYGKKTGNKILGPECRFCRHKDICNKNVSYRPSVISKAKNPKWEHYVGEINTATT